MRPISRPISTAKAIARNEDQTRRTRQIIVAFAAASAVALCSITIAKADNWVTVNPDGSVTRTQTTASATQRDYNNRDRDRNDRDRNDRDNDRNGRDRDHRDREDNSHYPNNDTRDQDARVVNNTTIYAGTSYPAPYVYQYYNPGGVTYNTQPQFGNFQPPTITTLPSTGYAYGYPAYGYPPYGYPPYGYPAPVYSTPYPLYGTTGVYYSGPAGGGGTIFSSTTTTNNGYGINIGNRGTNVQLGNRTNTTTSTTTVTTTR